MTGSRTEDLVARYEQNLREARESYESACAVANVPAGDMIECAGSSVRRSDASWYWEQAARLWRDEFRA